MSSQSMNWCKVLAFLFLLQLLGCFALFLVDGRTPADGGERIVLEYQNWMWLMTARVSCAVSLVILGVLALIAARCRR